MPALNEVWVRSVGLSNSRATLRGPASGLIGEGVGLQLVGQVQHRGLLGGGQVVVGQEVAERHGRSTVQQAGQHGDEGVQLVGA